MQTQSKVQDKTSTQDVTPFWRKQNNRYKYCWSCGSNASHTSAECTQRNEGHIYTVTFDNRQGNSVSRIPKRFTTLPRVKNGENTDMKICNRKTTQQHIVQAINHIVGKYLPQPNTQPMTIKYNGIKSFCHRAVMQLVAEEIFRVTVNHVYNDNRKKQNYQYSVEW